MRGEASSARRLFYFFVTEVATSGLLETTATSCIHLGNVHAIIRLCRLFLVSFSVCFIMYGFLSALANASGMKI